MQAIITKIIPATGTKPTRIKATCATKSYILSRNWVEEIATNPITDGLHYTYDCIQQRKLAFELVKQLGWDVKSMHTGDLANGDYVHVLTF